MSINYDNLVPNEARTPEERRHNAYKAGVASGIARRRKRQMREWLDIALSATMKDKRGNDLVSPDTGEPLTREEAATLQLVNAATKGDVRAFECIAKVLGEWVERRDVMLTADVTAVVRSIGDASQYIYNDYAPTYQRFFYNTRHDRHVLLQGGRRSGKTQATLRHLLRLTAAMGVPVKVMVATYQRPMLDNTIEDFVIATGVKPVADTATIGNAVWSFKSFDDFTKSQGTQCDLLFINEAVNMPDDIGRVLVQSARLQVYYNFNPTRTSWVQGKVADDGHNLICTTFRDNTYLPPAQVAEFEEIKRRALSPMATQRDKYFYQVYYLGNFATLVGAVFSNIATTDDYANVPANEYFGLDFGFATDGDPTVLVGVKLHDNKIYIRQYIYQRGLTSDTDLVSLMTAAGLTPETPIFADYGGMGRGRIQNLNNLGWSVFNASKTERIDGLSQMLVYDAVVIDSGSTATLAEFEKLELLPPTSAGHQRTKGDDHAIDAARYAFQRARYCEA